MKALKNLKKIFLNSFIIEFIKSWLIAMFIISFFFKLKYQRIKKFS